MLTNINFWINSFVLGVGLAMDSFSISIVDCFNEPKMKRNKMIFISLMFGLFQGLMPLIGWVCVSKVMDIFQSISSMIPYVALALLLWIGIDMFKDGLKKENDISNVKVTYKDIIVQSVATSIDALSVGFTIASYSFVEALICVSIICVVTFIISLLGCFIGKKFGYKFNNKASIIGGVILILIGLKIFIEGVIL